MSGQLLSPALPNKSTKFLQFVNQPHDSSHKELYVDEENAYLWRLFNSTAYVCL